MVLLPALAIANLEKYRVYIAQYSRCKTFEIAVVNARLLVLLKSLQGGRLFISFLGSFLFRTVFFGRFVSVFKSMLSVYFQTESGFARFVSQELWLPVMVPAHSTTIDVSVWHKEITGREVVAHAFFDFNSVREMSAAANGDKRFVVGDVNISPRFPLFHPLYVIPIDY